MRGEFNDRCAPAGRHGRAHRHRPYQSPPYFSAQFHTNKITICTESTQTTPPIPHTIRPNETNRPCAIYPNETVGAVPACPPERSCSGVSIPRTYALCAGNNRWMRPCGATRAGTQAPPLPISIKPCGVPLPIVHSTVHANHAVCHYPIRVVLSIAQGWQVQRSLPWVMVRGRMLPPWGLYFFSSRIITTRGEWMISHTKIDFKKYNADGIGFPPRLYPG